MPPDVPLNELADRLGIAYHGPVVVVDDVHHDSRTAGPGSLFVAIPGAVVDGHDYAETAVAAGAVALVVERPLELDVPQLVVENARRALPVVAAEVHGHPSAELTVIGVTGTNGKTTVTYMLESIARAAGRVPGLVGTTGARIDGAPVPVTRTTPESSDLQRLLAAMRDRHVDIAALEVSSHALALGRVDGVSFAVSAFTNLSHDHLDFHVDMEDYYRAKASLFSANRSRVGIVWVEDDWGRRLVDEIETPVRTVGFSPGCDVQGANVRVDTVSSHFDITAGGSTASVAMPLPGRFNVANALIAAACAMEAGIPLEDVAAGLNDLPPVPGRLELVPGTGPFTVIVDYAHSPDAISEVIDEARAFGAARVIVVIGAGGDRDREKRPLMGEAAAAADLTIITTDNPRSEDPAAIVEQVASGAGSDEHIVIELDRRTAISSALGAAREGDVVLVLGKGHEQGQEFADHVEPFDDRAVVREEWRSLQGAPESGAPS
ncbi:MAG: UDP-N-acetylmuramoyl-L-alanyl-D-glutamate--2,6-diaminopimelate ligase [Acidimicrobiia bacterium]|nr:UDP-N-acetylmuramoyl-L-alanyl-D-glutamate--2,6-diaminopimelate ligase [Acidimicrobiia bacterium]